MTAHTTSKLWHFATIRLVSYKGAAYVFKSIHCLIQLQTTLQ
jgi:hypothetical protein